mgnify:FL=1|jgi:hypothetical protein
MQENQNLLYLIEKLERRIEILEQENVNIVNEMYEISNSLEARIDILSPPEITLNNYSLGK